MWIAQPAGVAYTTIARGKDIGECHKRAPIVPANPYEVSNDSLWPIVRKDDTCGDACYLTIRDQMDDESSDYPVGSIRCDNGHCPKNLDKHCKSVEIFHRGPHNCHGWIQHYYDDAEISAIKKNQEESPG